jgi:Protein of unknown function, DUF599
MAFDLTWLAAFATVAILTSYEVALAAAQRRIPGRLARTAHASLRQEWFAAVSAQRGSEILAVQTLRNSLMSATMTASTAALGLIASATLSAPSLHTGFGAVTNAPSFTPRLALELVLLALLFASLVSSAMAIRYYNHAGFIASMPIDSEARRRWESTGSAYVRRAGVLYSWGLRHLIMIAPVLASILHPASGPIAAVLVVAALFSFDRIGTA